MTMTMKAKAPPPTGRASVGEEEEEEHRPTIIMTRTDIKPPSSTRDFWLQIASFLDPCFLSGSTRHWCLDTDCRAKPHALHLAIISRTRGRMLLYPFDCSQSFPSYSTFAFSNCSPISSLQTIKLSVGRHCQSLYARGARDATTLRAGLRNPSSATSSVCQKSPDEHFREYERIICFEDYGDLEGNLDLHFRPDAQKVKLSTVFSNTLYYGGEWVLSMSDASQPNNAPDNFMQDWLGYASQNLQLYNSTEQQAIREKRCPVVWIFDWAGDSNGYEMGIRADEDRNLCLFILGPCTTVAPQAVRNRQKGVSGNGCAEIHGLVHYFLLYRGVTMGDETLGPGQALFRLA